MFSMVRRRITFANLALTAALLFAMTGGAYAAKKYLITSTKQIKPSVLAQLKGKNGLEGKVGAQGPQGLPGSPGTKGDTGAEGKQGAAGNTGAAGAAGPTGPAGATGAKGATGATGPAGVAGGTGPQGTTGEPWAPNNALPKNATETGRWAVSMANSPERLAISIPIKLEKELDEAHTHVIGPTEGAGGIKESAAIKSGECHGTEASPGAGSGHLCVFVNPFATIESLNIIDPVTLAVGVSTTGALLFVSVETAEGQLAFGSWAVTG